MAPAGCASLTAASPSGRARWRPCTSALSIAREVGLFAWAGLLALLRLGVTLAILGLLLLILAACFALSVVFQMGWGTWDG
jgi:hypothetical protein